MARVERHASIVAAVVIPLMATSLRFWSLDRILRRIQRHRGSTLEDKGEALQAMVRAVARAGCYAPYRGNCLSQSLTLFWLLRRRGVAADLRLGARMREGRFEAHAWVERDGTVLNDRGDVGERFSPFPPLPPERIVWAGKLTPAESHLPDVPRSRN